MHDTAGTSPVVAIVIPCYNEAHRLELGRFAAFAKEHPNIRFFFVNDGSTDKTAVLLDEFCRTSFGSCSLVDLAVNGGKGEAVRRGVLAALRESPTFVGYWDADLATPLDAILDLLRVLTARASVEMVMGSRVRLMGRTIVRRATRHYAGRAFATAASLTLGIGVYDTQCGAKLFRVMPRTATLFADPFHSRWIFDVELVARQLAGLTREELAAADSLLVEWPLMHWEDVSGSKVKAGDFVLAAFELARIAYYYRLRRRPGR